jgi:pantoate--beta-alanine ligase
MQVANTESEINLAIELARNAGKKVAFVPTMGSIHKGHLSLIALAKEKADFVVASIFVNPLQFNSSADFDNYPRSEEEDSKALAEAGVDLLFVPTVAEIYPNGTMQPTESAGKIGQVYEGQARPGHFDGMLTVVSRLFDIVQPDLAVFGAKDAQQLFLVRQMLIRQNQDRKRAPIELLEGPTVRDERGLALSSRNARLSENQQQLALVLSKALEQAAQGAATGAGPTEAHRLASSVFSLNPEAKLDYLALVSPASFEQIEDGFSGQALMIVAATVGDVRLIDNRLITF